MSAEDISLAGFDRAAWRLSTFIGDWTYAIRGSRERQDHRQAMKRIRYLRTHLAHTPPQLRRDALELYRIRKAQGNV